ncbi:hypothetical protein AMELA_G00201170 [Ameiurus melas]|uniref:Sushi domain-containing protein n=1 Tax=Ameiurus melas TaxID=219545 RepID=A0A7J6A704_AMEME|nr:hypothetical protein AMELA_G00201170 [Ameiurus melas]
MSMMNTSMKSLKFSRARFNNNALNVLVSTNGAALTTFPTFLKVLDCKVSQSPWSSSADLFGLRGEVTINVFYPPTGLKKGKKMRETSWSRLIIFITCLMKAAEVQAQCVRPNVGENMVMNNDLGQQTFLNGSTVTFQCSTGYRPVDSSVPRMITCVGTEWTNLELNCTKKTCGALPDLPNGKYTYPNGILFGATAIAQCNEGYLLVGEKNRNCRDNGWDGRDPVCEVVKCSPPSSIQNGLFDPVEDSYDYNQAVTYSCTGSYTLIGKSVLTCSNNGTFHPSPPKCLLVECETPNIKNAVRVEGKSPPYGYKNFVRYECNEGYIMNGTGHLVCEENGWNPPPPECLSQCVRPNVGENMVMNNDSDQQTFLNGSTVTFQCSTGYRPVDSSVPRTITCVGTEWTHLELNCTIDRIQDPITTSPPSDGNCVKPSIITIAAVVSIVVLLGPKNYHLD